MLVELLWRERLTFCGPKRIKTCHNRLMARLAQIDARVKISSPVITGDDYIVFRRDIF